MTSHPEKTLREYCATIASARNMLGTGGSVAKLDYAGIEGLLLKHGRFWRGTPLPHGVKVGRPKACFANAGGLVLDHPDRYTYVEGLGLKPGLIPLAHAWVIDDNDHVVDPTWDSKPVTIKKTGYLGIPIKTEWLRARVCKTGLWGIFETDCGVNMALIDGSTPLADWMEAA